MVAKLSSVMTMSAVSLATSVPLIPMAMPMSACLQGRGVVDAVAGHGHDLAPPPGAPRRSAACARARPGRRRRPRRRRAAQPASSRPSSSRACTVCSGLPRASRSRPSCRPISAAVAGWSPVIIDGADARLPAGRDRRLGLLAERVDHPDQPDEDEVAGQVLLAVPLGQVPVGQGQDPQGAGGQLLVGRDDPAAVLVVQGPDALRGRVGPGSRRAPRAAPP